MRAKVFPTDQMTSRERMLAAYRGEGVDRLPFWAKVNNPTWRSSQPKAVRKRSAMELLDDICADGLFMHGRFVECLRPHVAERRIEDDKGFRGILETPDGTLSEYWAIDTYTNSVHPTEFFVKTVEDIARYRWYWTDVEVRIDADRLQAARQTVKAIGERGIVGGGWGCSPLMHLVEHVIGPMDTHLMLFDAPGRMDELLFLFRGRRLRAKDSSSEC